MPDPVLDPVLTPPTMAPTVGHVEAITQSVTDKQTLALNIASWIRLGVSVVVILLGVVKPAPPTPPDQAIAALIKVLEQNKPPPAAPAPAKTLETATMSELTAALEKAMKEAKGK